MMRAGDISSGFGALRMPREVVFGAGQRFALGPLTRQLGSRAFICTDERMSADAGYAALVDNLREAGVETMTYSNTLPEVPLDNVAGSVRQARSFAPDVVVGIGGGSCLDLAKFTALMLTHEGRLQDYYGEFRVPGPVRPVVAVPTTSGTGSEASPVAVLADPERELKVGVASPWLVPHTAICDPELTFSSPPGLTASTGADALTHAIEALTAVRRPASSGLVRQHVFVGKNALSDHYALFAISLIASSLQRAFEHGDDTLARERMMLGSLSAGIAFGTAGTAAAHAIQYPVGAATHTPHGVGVALLLPYVMEFNRPASVREFAQIAMAMNAGDGTTDEAGLADRAIAAVADLVHSVGIPHTLKDLGLPEDKQGWTVEQALTATRLVKNNPRPLDHESVERIVRAAFTGQRAMLREA